MFILSPFPASLTPFVSFRAFVNSRSFDVCILSCKLIGPDEYVVQMTTFLERRYLATIHTTIVSAEDQEKDYALAVK